MEVSGTLHPGRFTPGNPQKSRPGGPQNRSGSVLEEKNLLNLPGFEHRTVKPVSLSLQSYWLR
jgi:hypothetical protein